MKTETPTHRIIEIMKNRGSFVFLMVLAPLIIKMGVGAHLSEAGNPAANQIANKKCRARNR